MRGNRHADNGKKKKLRLNFVFPSSLHNNTSLCRSSDSGEQFGKGNKGWRRGNGEGEGLRKYKSKRLHWEKRNKGKKKDI